VGLESSPARARAPESSRAPLSDKVTLLPELTSTPPLARAISQVPPSIDPIEESLDVEGVATELGGVLFLIHALLELDLASLLDAAISPWAALEYLATSLVPPEESACFAEVDIGRRWNPRRKLLVLVCVLHRASKRQ